MAGKLRRTGANLAQPVDFQLCQSWCFYRRGGALLSVQSHPHYMLFLVAESGYILTREQIAPATIGGVEQQAINQSREVTHVLRQYRH
jgi:hypothetical protein